MNVRDEPVVVTADWALRGRGPGQAGDYLLDYSEGHLGADEFGHVLDYFSPGTLVSLPQVTVSWMTGAQVAGSLLGVAIHSLPEAVGAVGADRQFAETRYFCMEFAELADRNVSYCDMYAGLRYIRLPVSGRDKARAVLNVGSPEPRPDRVALHAAALLLTGRPVCVLGADQAGTQERLRFIDEVASLLPYGMRAQLSASTWANSTYRTHRIRLFFSSVPRNDDDFLLTWQAEASAPSGGELADRYLAWLDSDPPARIAELSAFRFPLDFKWTETPRLLRRLRLEPVSSVSASLRSVDAKAPAVYEVLKDCASRLGGDDPGSVRVDVQLLEQLLDQELVAVEGRRYQEQIAALGLLREDLRVTRSLRERLYLVMLRIGFGVPLTYDSFCIIADSIVGDKAAVLPIHPPLAAAMRRAGIGELRVKLLVLAADDREERQRSLHADAVSPGELVELIGDESSRPAHRQLLAQVVLDYLEWRAVDLGQETLRAALEPAGYLAADCRDLYPDDLNYQQELVARALRLSYGKKLDRNAVSEVTRTSSTLTPALRAAVRSLADGAAVGQATDLSEDGKDGSPDQPEPASVWLGLLGCLILLLLVAGIATLIVILVN